MTIAKIYVQRYVYTYCLSDILEGRQVEDKNVSLIIDV